MGPSAAYKSTFRSKSNLLDPASSDAKLQVSLPTQRKSRNVDFKTQTNTTKQAGISLPNLKIDLATNQALTPAKSLSTIGNQIVAQRNASISPSSQQRIGLMRKESPESPLRQIASPSQHAIIQENEYKNLIRSGYDTRPPAVSIPQKGEQKSEQEYNHKLLQNKSALKKPSMLDTKPSRGSRRDTTMNLLSQAKGSGSGNLSTQMQVKLQMQQALPNYNIEGSPQSLKKVYL